MYTFLKIMLAATFMAWAVNANAAQNLQTDANGEVSFNVSTTGVTRVSVVGDRIRRIVNDSDSFEMTNDETTGDVYFRALDETARNETGFILTERGVTIGYTMRPTSRVASSVLITITGQKHEPTQETGDFSDGFGFSDDVAMMMTDIVRDIAIKHVVGRDVPSGRDGRTVRRINGDGWKASIRIAVAGADGRLIREQDFYSSSVRAIWIANPTLAANERTFIIVVEAI